MYVKIHVSPEKRLNIPIPRFNPSQIPNAPKAAVNELFDTEPIAKTMATHTNVLRSLPASVTPSKCMLFCGP